MVKFITLSGSITLLVDFITLLEQNVIIDIFQDILLLFMAAILKTGI